MYSLLCFAWSDATNLDDPPSMSPTISCWIHFFKVTIILISWLLSFWPCLSKNDFVSASCPKWYTRILCVSFRWRIVDISWSTWIWYTVASIVRFPVRRRCPCSGPHSLRCDILYFLISASELDWSHDTCLKKILNPINILSIKNFLHCLQASM